MDSLSLHLCIYKYHCKKIRSSVLVKNDCFYELVWKN